MARLNIHERPADNAIILDLTGDLIFGEGTNALRRTIRGLVNDGKSKIFINLKGVIYLDSSGIGELISALTAINREENGQLKLLNPPERIQELLEIAKLLTVFDIEYEEDRAVGV